MSPELPKDIELSLKKRARRRLVGAIALVLLMVIILPMILQDRTAPAPKEAIKITMHEASEAPVDESATQQALVDSVEAPQDPVAPMVTDNPIAEVIDKVEPKAKAKAVVSEPLETKVADAKPVQKNSASFAIQVGVYSDLANVKQLQTKLKKAGFVSHTEKIATPKGEKIRLRVGKFPSRQEAADTLDKLKASGFSGMVISND